MKRSINRFTICLLTSPLLFAKLGSSWILFAIVFCLPSTVFATHSHFGSSPFAPPDPTDTTFVVDQGRGLDTGCTFRSRGPLVFEIKVTRFVGEVNADGTLKDPATLIANGIVSDTATLNMPAFDVDFTTSIPPPFQPERDKILFNGQDIGFLNGLNNTWIQNSFDIPIAKVKFPGRAPTGSTPTPAINTITINIDTANTAEIWCTAIDWAVLSFKAMSPIILIHGNNSNSGFFDRQGFTGVLQNQRFPLDNTINLPTTDIQTNGANLNNLIPNIVNSFGVDSIHLVVHSKGGLDSREYLANHQLAHNDSFKILSYTSLSTPHNGSVGADLLVQRDDAVAVQAELEFVDFPTFTDRVAEQATTNPGIPNLTTTFVAGFNANNIPRLPAGIVFNTVAADMDQNGNGEVDHNPDEYAELRAESPELAMLETQFPPFSSRSKAQIAVNVVYQILRSTASITVTYRTERRLLGGTRTIASFTRMATPTMLGNDGLVTIPSGQGVGSIAARTANTVTFTAAQGRNHSSVANTGVASTVLPWIVNVERTRGDFQ